MHFIVATNVYGQRIARDNEIPRGMFKILSTLTLAERALTDYRLCSDDNIWLTDDPGIRWPEELADLVYAMCDRGEEWPKFRWIIDGRESVRPVGDLAQGSEWDINVETIDDLIAVRNALQEYIRERWREPIPNARVYVGGVSDRANTEIDENDGYTISREDYEGSDEWSVSLHGSRWEEDLLLDGEDLARIRQMAEDLHTVTRRHQARCARAIFETLLLGYVPRPRRQLHQRIAPFEYRGVTLHPDAVPINEVLDWRRLGVDIGESMIPVIEAANRSAAEMEQALIDVGRVASMSADDVASLIEAFNRPLFAEHAYGVEFHPDDGHIAQVARRRRWVCSCGAHSRAWRNNSREAAEGHQRHVQRQNRA